MSFDLVRRSLKNLFLYDKKPSKEPLKQESVSSSFTLEPNISSYSQNKFTAIQKKKERFNPYKFAFQRLVDFHQKSSKIKDPDQLAVIKFVEQKSEKKVKTKMIHPRWNHDESSSECMGDSLHLRNSFVQNQVESHQFHNQPSASKQDIQPYYVQPARQQVTYQQSLQAHLNKVVDIDKTRFRNVALPSRSTIQFQRNEQQQSKQFEKSESPQIKNLREQVGPQLQKITKAVESKQDSPVPIFPPLVESKIFDQNPKQSVNKFQEIKKLEIPLSFKHEEPQKIEKQSTAKEDITKVETQPASPEKPKQVTPQVINEIPAPQVTQILPPQANEQPTQNEIIQPQTTSNPFLIQPTQPMVVPWINQPQPPVQTSSFNVFQPASIPQPVNQMPFQNQNQAPNLFQSQNLFPQQLQQGNQSFFSQFPQSQTSNPMFDTNINSQQQSNFPNTQSLQQQPLFQFQQPPQQQSQSQSPFAFQTNALGGGSFSAADQNQPKPILDLFQQQTPTSGNSQQINLFSSFNDKPVQQQNQNKIYQQYRHKLQEKGQQRME